MNPLIFLGCSGMAFLFLIHSIRHRKKLGITLTHPRILVEFALFLLFLSAAFNGFVR